MSTIHIIGGGLAGSEAAWQAAQAGSRVVLHEMRPRRMTEAHTGEGLAELVCSNSFRSDDWENNAVGLLHEEMRRLGSLIMRAADAHKLPAGGALAVDRAGFSAGGPGRARSASAHRDRARGSRWIRPRRGTASSSRRVRSPRPRCRRRLRALTGEESLAFFDAIAPIVERESIDMSEAWLQSRYDKKGPAAATRTTSTARWTRSSTARFVRELLDGRRHPVPRMGEVDALFRGLPAHRGDGGARRRHAALRTDEAGGLARSEDRAASLRRGAAAPGQRARHAVEHGRLPDQAQIRRADAHLPHDPGAEGCALRAARRHPPQHLPQFAAASR